MYTDMCIFVETDCFSYFKVVMELAELGDMESYLRNRKKGFGVLKVYHLVSTAEQVAQALTYLVCLYLVLAQKKQSSVALFTVESSCIVTHCICSKKSWQISHPDWVMFMAIYVAETSWCADLHRNLG